MLTMITSATIGFCIGNLMTALVGVNERPGTFLAGIGALATVFVWLLEKSA